MLPEEFALPEEFLLAEEFPLSEPLVLCVEDVEFLAVPEVFFLAPVFEVSSAEVAVFVLSESIILLFNVLR